MARKRSKFRPGLELVENRTLMSTTPVNLGVNLDIPQGNGSGGDVFVDLRNEFHAWGQPATPTTPDSTIPLTSDGYPLANAGTYIDFTGYAPGAYQLSFTGTGTVSFSGPGKLEAAPVKGADGVSHALVDLGNSSSGWLGMYITNISTSDPVRNLHLIAPGYSPTTTQVYTNDYLNLVAPFSTLRTMDWSNTNYSTDGVWADRTLPTTFSQLGSQGVSWEDQIALANEANKDLWINIPDKATPSYVQNLAQLIHSTLNPNLHIDFEYSNETWNNGTPQYSRVAALANADSRVTATDPLGKISQESALQLKADADIFRQVFGVTSTQVRPIFAGIAAYAYYTSQGLSLVNSLYGDPSQYFYAAAVAPYMDISGSGGQMTTLDQVFASMQTYFTNNIVPFITSSATVAHQWNLPLVSYEGGQSLSASSGLSGALVINAQNDPRMGQLYTQLMNTWTQNAGGVFNHYSLVGASGPYGAWALLPTVTAPGSVRWDTLMNLEYGPGDANNDGKVDFTDFTTLTANYGATNAYRSQGDFNADGTVNAADLTLLRANLGSTVTPAQALTIAQYGIPQSVALGSTTVFNAGGQSNNGLTYTWTQTQAGASAISSTSPTYNFTPAVSGTATIILKVTNALGLSASATITIVVSTALGNSGFETPALAANSYAYDPTGATWNFTGSSGIADNGSAFTNGNAAAPAGLQVAFLQGTGSAAQTLAGMAAGTYRVTLQAAQRGNYQSSRQDFQVLVDGQVVATLTPSGTAYQSFTTSPFTITSGSHTLTLKGLDSAGGDNTVFVDGVAINLVPAAVSVATPGFESPVLPASGYLYNPAATAWTYAGTSGVAANGSVFTTSNPAAPDGTQVAFLEGSGGISQSVAGWAAGSYQVCFQAAQRGSGNTNPQTIQVLIDGTAVGSFTPTGTAYQTFLTTPFNVAAGTHTVSFQGLNPLGGDNTALLDSVMVTSAALPIGDASLENVALAPGAYAYTPTGSAWSFTAGGGISANNSAFTSGNPAAPAGTQVALLQSNGSMSQSLSGWIAGNYQISFQAAQRANAGTSRQILQVLIDGKSVAMITPSSTSYALYTTPAFTVTAGTHTLTIQGTNTTGDNTAFVDAIAAQVTTAATTPALLSDAGFEQPAQSANGYTYNPTGTAWTFQGAGVAANGSAFTNGNAAAPEGSQVAFLQNTGSISQSVSGVTAGTYQISFQAAQRANYQSKQQNFQVLVDGTAVATFTPTSTAYAAYQTATFSLTAGAHTIAFQGLDSAGGDNTAFLDSIVIQTSGS